MLKNTKFTINHNGEEITSDSDGEIYSSGLGYIDAQKLVDVGILSVMHTFTLRRCPGAYIGHATVETKDHFVLLQTVLDGRDNDKLHMHQEQVQNLIDVLRDAAKANGWTVH
jgi:hypothetical protein